MELKDKTIVLLQIHNIRIPKQFQITPPGNDRIPLDLKFVNGQTTEIRSTQLS